MELVLESEDVRQAEKTADEWADKLLSNPNMENYSLTLEPIS
ncbi:MAG: phosphoribosylformylglycinamidine synthase subunit PurS [Deltaproteobacteria bacterium]|nr:phosphoribosylformylglycinamidine synthase subunit PurS [Deltaproteobacteria bacterium]